MVEQVSKINRKRGTCGLILFALLTSLGMSAMMARQAWAAADKTPQQAAPPEAPQSLHLLVGRSLVITSPTRIKRISLADPTIAEVDVITPTQIVINGKVPGGVSLLLWDEADQSQAFEISVDVDVLT